MISGILQWRYWGHSLAKVRCGNVSWGCVGKWWSCDWWPWEPGMTKKTPIKAGKDTAGTTLKQPPLFEVSGGFKAGCGSYHNVLKIDTTISILKIPFTMKLQICEHLEIRKEAFKLGGVHSSEFFSKSENYKWEWDGVFSMRVFTVFFVSAEHWLFFQMNITSWLQILVITTFLDIELPTMFRGMEV